MVLIMSHKSKQNSKKKKQYKSFAERQQMLHNSIKNAFPASKLVWKDSGDKLSDVIVAFAQPLLEKCSGLKAQKKIMPLAILAWNMGMVSEEEAAKIKKDLHEKICGGDEQTIKDMDEIIDYLIARKKRLYREDKRLVVSYNITESPDGLHLDVAYPHAPA
jgi:intergrase/recombinase